MTPPDTRHELHYAALDGDAARVRELVLGGTAVDVEDDNGWTPLFFAVERGDTDMVQLLVDLGATVDHTDTYGATPLFRAVYTHGGECPVVPILVRAGADPEKVNAHGISAREEAERVDDVDDAGPEFRFA